MPTQLSPRRSSLTKAKPPPEWNGIWRQPGRADMRYKTFGRRTGLRVSEVALGAGNFGTEWGYGSEPDASRAMFDAYATAGGNFIDTSDNYQFGQSEELVGEFISGERDRFVIASKY